MKLGDKLRTLKNSFEDTSEFYEAIDKVADDIDAIEAELAAASQKERERLAKLAESRNNGWMIGLKPEEIRAGKLFD